LRSEEFIWPVRVYYEDTDSAGLVYHASYLRFMERARTEWMRDHGFELSVLTEEFELLFTVSRMQIEFLMPARFNDFLDVTVAPTRIGGASLSLDQLIRRESHGLVCRAKVRIACVDARSMRPRALPNNVLAELRRDTRPVPD
jgi:acyl-CoA thioester hydrolase